jgi:hypothetical protein
MTQDGYNVQSINMQMDTRLHGEESQLGLVGKFTARPDYLWPISNSFRPVPSKVHPSTHHV